jgi:hypothetical protein
MELLILLAFIGGWCLLAVLAARFGHDSRDGIAASPQGPLWWRPDDKDRPPPSRGRRTANPAPVRTARIGRVAPAA